MRLIDADALKEHIGSFAGMFTDEGFLVDLTAVLSAIDYAPTIEAEPVVRCKDCKHWDFGDCYRQELTRPDDFCSYGERRSNETV